MMSYRCCPTTPSCKTFSPPIHCKSPASISIVPPMMSSMSESVTINATITVALPDLKEVRHKTVQDSGQSLTWQISLETFYDTRGVMLWQQQ